MSTLTPLVNTLVAFGTLLAQIAIVWGIIALIRGERKTLTLVKHYGLLASFIIILGAVIGSLYYSTIAGYAPCVLCWWQRVFIFSQFPILLFALWKKDSHALSYTFPLSIIGGVIALYHTYIQYGGSELIPCGTDVNAVSCAVRYVYEWNYITIPLMSLTAFALLIVITLLARKAK